jgi:hypothetical protein
LESATAAFLELCDYRGLGSLEFKWDPTRRAFIVIEPTVGRTDWQEEVATLNGANIPLFAYRDLAGLSNDQPVQPPQLVAWRESWHRWRSRSALSADLPLYDGYWRLSDPLPSLAHYASEAARVAGQMTQRLFAAAAAKRRQGVGVGKQL